jgi:type I restriction enzyme S subunit
MANAKTPDIRFAGFDGNWEYQKFGDVVSTAIRPVEMDNGTSYQCVTVKRRNEGVVSRGFYKGSEILVKSQFRAKTGDYLISKRQIVHGANGIVPDELNNAIVSNEYLVLQDSEDLDVAFLAIASKLPFMYKAFFLSSYGVHIEKMLFDFEDWKKRGISLPKTKEQQMITAFHHDLDTLITLQQSKYEKTVNIKAACLERMFPKKGERVPEVRFSGFSGEWEERRLGDASDLYDNLRIPVAENLRKPGKTPYYGANGIQGYIDGYTHDGEYVLVAEDGASDLLNYPVRYVNGKIHAHVLQGKPNETDTLYLSYALKKADFQAVLVGGTRAKLNAGAMKEMPIFVTSFEEQTSTGNFFRNLDTLISSYRQELNKLKNIKKALLGRMFVQGDEDV